MAKDPTNGTHTALYQPHLSPQAVLLGSHLLMVSISLIIIFFFVWYLHKSAGPIHYP